ncbi:MAG TPA: hypothetical protein VHZ51_07360 [Ktedonobacteraceae bacterium]|nr:hypothetical protein [Ktedonobacteraceae bacterium]
MLLDHIRYELRIIGRWILLIPLLIVAGLVLLTIFLSAMKVDHVRLSQILTASLEMLLPLATGVMVATFVSPDHAIELQLTFPRMYRVTAFLRLLLMSCWTGCVAAISSVFLYHWKYLRIPAVINAWGAIPQVFVEQLTWLAPLSWLVSVGLCIALLTRSRTASSAILAGIWIAEAVFYGYFIYTSWLQPLFLFPTTLAPYITFWFTNRYIVLGTALVFFVLGWLLLHNTEALLQGTAGEE